jgi:hypothetical protein
MIFKPFTVTIPTCVADPGKKEGEKHRVSGKRRVSGKHHTHLEYTFEGFSAAPDLLEGRLSLNGNEIAAELMSVDDIWKVWFNKMIERHQSKNDHS